MLHMEFNIDFKSFTEDINILRSLIDNFPYPIMVFAESGRMVAINKDFIKVYNILDSDVIFKNYNVYKDNEITTEELLPCIKRVFKGETCYRSTIKVPAEEIFSKFGFKDPDVESAYVDVVIFPIFDNGGNIPYAATLFFNRRDYKGKKEIAVAKEYIKNHCVEKLNIAAVAKISCLSKTHLTRLFKKHTGLTVHEYYLSCKLELLKELLLNPDISIAHAFNLCGLSYSGHFANFFKEKTGYTPSKYREKMLNGK